MLTQLAILHTQVLIATHCANPHRRAMLAPMVPLFLRRVLVAFETFTQFNHPEIRVLQSRLSCLNVSKPPAQPHRDDQNYGDHAEISEPFSDGRMLPHLVTLKFFKK